ncbi:hypothetical protein ACOCEA_03400 [Maribacter sp. CXY002]|uniref:hypothetical protein n=1 Tax=Maribacter luteocoastalis TaxID=3407671 RepID=UPI003B680C6C
MKNYLTILTVFLTLHTYGQSAAYKQLRPPVDNISNDIKYWNTPRCYAYLKKITTTHERLHSMYPKELRSSFLEEVHFYTAPNSPIYVVVKFYSNAGYNIYCEVPGWEVDNFLPENYESYGEKFQDHISPYKCNCR